MACAMHECVTVPRESCQLTFSKPKPSKARILTKWCLDDPAVDAPEEVRSIGDIPILQLDRKEFLNRSKKQIISLLEFENKIPEKGIQNENIEAANLEIFSFYIDARDSTNVPQQTEKYSISPNIDLRLSKKKRYKSFFAQNLFQTKLYRFI